MQAVDDKLIAFTVGSDPTETNTRRLPIEFSRRWPGGRQLLSGESIEMSATITLHAVEMHPV
ncbi:hypothetical protein T265_12227 [Opisthorchis viverrini]|uniref:Uncharacterized protein n=1 Tax=Opisthorchis viverrini TaxID=6198 RepID=A0A074ZTK1_OPIVI|nr:hypothetical protein T265_12227 [Opisthorchis viverrini]KER18569.1 hypothetical protein T265_12227 [Opisthorchis viverrini]